MNRVDQKLAFQAFYERLGDTDVLESLDKAKRLGEARTMNPTARFWGLFEVFIEVLKEHSKLHDLFKVTAIERNEALGATSEFGGRRWTETEDQWLVDRKASGESIVEIAVDMGRSPGAVATRISYLVGVKRLFININGEIVGNLDGEDIEGHFIGQVARNA